MRKTSLPTIVGKGTVVNVYWGLRRASWDAGWEKEAFPLLPTPTPGLGQWVLPCWQPHRILLLCVAERQALKSKALEWPQWPIESVQCPFSTSFLHSSQSHESMYLTLSSMTALTLDSTSTSSWGSSEVVSSFVYVNFHEKLLLFQFNTFQWDFITNSTFFLVVWLFCRKHWHLFEVSLKKHDGRDSVFFLLLMKKWI